jgi:hypothetical protein
MEVVGKKIKILQHFWLRTGNNNNNNKNLAIGRIYFSESGEFGPFFFPWKILAIR